MSVKNRNSIVTDGLVFYVDAGNEDSYPGSGTTWSDLVGSDDGTLTNGPTYDSANGGSIVFDGANDYVNATSFVIPSQVTVSAWINPDSTSATRQIVTSDDSTSGTRNWQFRTDAGGALRAIVFHTSSPSNVQAVTTATVSTGAWSMVTMKVDGTNIKVYINGVEDVSASFPYSILGNGSAGDLLVGARRSSSPSDHLDGKVALASIYNRGLTDAEITQNYNALKNRFI